MVDIHFLLLTTFLCQFYASTSGHFFPNISSIPPPLIPIAAIGPWQAFRNLTNCSPGATFDGLSSLKRYFHNFGYLRDSANLTDDFDDDLQSAVQTYQRNFNLDPTGQLDSATMATILRPRCGVADIVNGSTTMNSAKRPEGFHAVAHYSFFPGSPRWSQQDLTYAFLPQNDLSDDVKSVFRRAFARWAEVARITFTEATSASFSLADIRVGFFSGDHGDGEAFDGVLGTLAHAFSPPSGRFHLDAEEEWVLDLGEDNSRASSIAVHLESVAVHEIGHVLGLGHSSVRDSIMYPSITSGTRKVELAADDVRGIQELYGSNPSYNGSATATSASDRERETSGDDSGKFRWRSFPCSLVVGLVLAFQLVLVYDSTILLHLDF